MSHTYLLSLLREAVYIHNESHADPVEYMPTHYDFKGNTYGCITSGTPDAKANVRRIYARLLKAESIPAIGNE